MTRRNCEGRETRRKFKRKYKNLPELPSLSAPYPLLGHSGTSTGLPGQGHFCSHQQSFHLGSSLLVDGGQSNSRQYGIIIRQFLLFSETQQRINCYFVRQILKFVMSLGKIVMRRISLVFVYHVQKNHLHFLEMQQKRNQASSNIHSLQFRERKTPPVFKIQRQAAFFPLRNSDYPRDLPDTNMVYFLVFHRLVK